MGIPSFEKNMNIIQGLSDLPNANDGLTADQLKAKFDEAGQMLKTYINEVLVPALLAENIPFANVVGITGETVQEAIVDVQRQIRDAAGGAIPDGTVEKRHLSAELLERTFGGVPWVSMEAPAGSGDYPVGQIWLRPGFTVKNAAKTEWTGNGCTVTDGVVAGSKTAATATASQAYTGLGNTGDRVLILFDTADRNQEVRSVTLRVNAGAAADVTERNTVEASLLEGGALSLEFTTTWSSAALAEDGWTIKDLTVVNLDAAVRQTEDAKEPGDWAAFLRDLTPFESRTFQAEAYMQTKSGVWWPVITQAQEDGYLKTVGGQPKWMTAEETVGDLAAGRYMSGSYTGNGDQTSDRETRTVELPIAPKILLVSAEGGPQIGTGSYRFDDLEVFQQGTKSVRTVYATNTSGGNQFSWPNHAELKENRLVITSESDFYGALMLNRPGVVYNWTAIY